MKAAQFDYVRPPDLDGGAAAAGRAPRRREAPGRRPVARPDAQPAARAPAAARSTWRALEALAARSRTSARPGGSAPASRIRASRMRAASFAGGEMLSDVAAGIAYRAVRNRGTIGGSLAHADPAADWPVALAAFGASVNLRSDGGTRSLPVERFMLGAFTTALADDEIIESIDVPKLSGAGALRLLQVLPQDRRVRRSERRGRVRSADRRGAHLPRRAAQRRRCRSQASRAASPSADAPPPRRTPCRRRSPKPRPTSTRSSGAWRPPRSRAPSTRCFGHDADHAHRQRPARSPRWSSRARTSATSCASIAGSPARISAASTACAAPARS